jgi:Mn2+/Fe2+ NRAMP family transporter
MSFWQRIRPFRLRLALLFAVVGPGIITANVDNDAAGITTYSVSGAHYGYSLLWLMPIITITLIVVQEMSARLGVVTGRGLAALIRESIGVRATAWILLILVFANIANTVSEFAGVAAAMEIFGVNKFISVPIAGILVWFLVVKGNYQRVERIFLMASVVYLAYVFSGLLVKPDWNEVAMSMVTPSIRFDPGYLAMAITMIGTTISPWMQFYQQSAIVDKHLKISDYAYERADVIIGSIFAVFVATFIILTCAATLHVNGIHIESAKDAGLAFGPLAGKYAETLFVVGLLNASVFAAAILPLSTAYVVCEAFGWENGVNNEWKQAPVFYIVYTLLIVIGAGVILLPIKSLIQAMMWSQTLNGILLPLILIVMLRLINDKHLMGKHINGKLLNVISIIVVAALIILTIFLLASSVAPGLLN